MPNAVNHMVAMTSLNESYDNYLKFGGDKRIGARSASTITNGTKCTTKGTFQHSMYAST